MKKHIYALLFLLLAVCSNSRAAQPETTKPHIVAGSDTSALICWYAEREGIRGFAAQDARLSSWSPTGGGLFKTLSDFREQLQKQGLTDLLITTTGPKEGFLKEDWKVRKLTSEEMNELKQKTAEQGAAANP